MKKDIIAKSILEVMLTLTEDIANILLKLDISNISFVSKELKTIEKREVDIVAKCLIKGKKEILHIEIQNDNDKTMPNRMLRYFNDINAQYPNMKINQYLIYIGKNKLNMKDYIKEDKLEYSYTILDIKDIDCNELIKLDTPDALVLSILCDFKGKNNKKMLEYLVSRIQELTKDNSNKLGKYMLMLETLSGNRDLYKKVKEVEAMLRDISVEKSHFYERGEKKGEKKGKLEGKLEAAKIMIKDFNLSVEEVAKKLDIPIENLLYLKK